MVAKMALATMEMGRCPASTARFREYSEKSPAEVCL